MAILDKSLINRSLLDEKYLGWNEYEGYLQKEFIFQDFKHAMMFVNSVAYIAELENHHPDINISWNKVILSLSTHDEGGVTEKDIYLAEKINRI